MSDWPLPIGTVVIDGNGDQWTIGAVMVTGGERYYFLDAAPHDYVAMWPATLVESMDRVPTGTGGSR